MTFSIGGSASASKTTKSFSNNSSSTTTPTVPEWASNLTQSVAGRVGAVNGLDPYSLTSPVNALQQQAAGGASALSGTPWNYEAALGETGSVMNANAPRTEAVSASSYIDRYLNPYLREVVDSTSADLDADAGRVRAQQALDLAGAGAFGGSGTALTQSMTEGELARARASSLAGLRSQGFTTALGAAQQDATRRQSANDLNAQLYAGQMDRALASAGQLGSLASSYEAGQRANVATQAGLGETLRSIDQEQRQAPVTSAQQVVAMLSGLPIQLFTGSQMTGAESGKSSETALKLEAKTP